MFACIGSGDGAYMFALVITAVLAQANQSTPIPAECFEKPALTVALNTLQLVEASRVEFKELSGPREGDEKLAASLVYPLNLLQSGLGMLTNAMVMRSLERPGRVGQGEGLMRMAMSILKMGLRTTITSLAAAEASTRAYQLEKVTRLKSGLDEFNAIIGPCIP